MSRFAYMLSDCVCVCVCVQVCVCNSTCGRWKGIRSLPQPLKVRTLIQELAFCTVEAQNDRGDNLQRALFILKVPFPKECFKNSFFGIPSSTGGRMFVNVDSELLTSQSLGSLRWGQGAPVLPLRVLRRRYWRGQLSCICVLALQHCVPVRVSV